MTIKKSLLGLLGLAVAANVNIAEAKQIRAVGSSTVYPFVTVIAEEFGRQNDYKTPIIESTGTGGGFKLFCSGAGKQHPDIVNASRAIKNSEEKLCAENGVEDITEVKIGFGGIVLANNVESPRLSFTREQVFLALAREVPKDGKLIKNPYTKWSEIDASLPDTKIELYGPPPTSGTRDAFVELVMESICTKHETFVAAFPDKMARKHQCHLIREDGIFIESGENDNLIVQKLRNNPDAVGIFDYSFLDQNESSVQGSIIDEAEPTFENIASGAYIVSRPLYVYLKTANLKTVDGFSTFAQELVSDDAIGEDGYLTVKGLIPLQEDALIELQDRIAAVIN